MRLLSLLSAPFLLAALAPAAANRYLLAGQFDFGAKKGFYLQLECESPGDQICTLANLKLFFAVADGSSWQFPSFAPPEGWQLNHIYRATGTVSPEGAVELQLDGKRVATAKGGPLAPSGGKLAIADIPDWASGNAEYRVREGELDLASGTFMKTVHQQSEGAAPPALYLLGKKDAGQTMDFSIQPGARLTVSATFTLERVPDWKSLAPLVDKFGQSVYGTWPEKLSSVEELLDAKAKEEAQNASWGLRTGVDRFGGDLASPWKEKATGFFRTVKHDGKYWLISPEGSPTFFTGICTAPDVEWDFTPVAGREAMFAEIPTSGPFRRDNAWGGSEDGAYVSFQGMNALRKYGENWKEASSKEMVERTNVWGFSGLGKWCDAPAGLPSLPVLTNDAPKLVRHLDPWDPAAQKAILASLKAQISPRRYDSAVVGWSIGNEFDEIVTTDEIRQVLKDHPGSPAALAIKKAVAVKAYRGDEGRRDDAWNAGIPDADLETMRTQYARAYYELLYKTVKSIDPDHLYLGFWIVPGWWQNETDWQLIAPYCDVIGYDRYAPVFADEWFSKLLASTDKPVLCGEFSYPPYHDGLRSFAKYSAVSVETEEDAGAAYAKWIQDATKNPYCVGGAWFQYRDEPITGRGPGHGTGTVYGEDFAFGLVDVTDRPKWPLVRAVREANLKATELRLAN